MTVASGQGIEISTGALAINNTGEFTGISLDRFIVKTALPRRKSGGEK
jgi:hypothetical protein